uniref:Uncharacterized protein n=1 Tax=Octopus bimaculoides TaxID=37653 RepID=A0A0L8HAZ2_OCTBM
MFGGNFDIYFSPCLPNMGGGGTAVLFRKSLNLKVRPIFLDPEGRLVVLDVDGTNG